MPTPTWMSWLAQSKEWASRAVLGRRQKAQGIGRDRASGRSSLPAGGGWSWSSRWVRRRKALRLRPRVSRSRSKRSFPDGGWPWPRRRSAGWLTSRRRTPTPSVGRGGAAPGAARARRSQRGSPGAGPPGRRFAARSCRRTRARADPRGAPQRRRPAGDHRRLRGGRRQPPRDGAGTRRRPSDDRLQDRPDRIAHRGTAGRATSRSAHDRRLLLPASRALGRRARGAGRVVADQPAVAPQDSQSAVGPVPATASR